ncbi:MAG: hypothetical protein K940chlam7_01582 [Chlamydiae bacterium]|nr:hypothetical protein [Chlamydiota bacterium]
MECDPVSGCGPINNCVPNVMTEIFSYLSADQLARMREVCRQWKTLAERDSLWAEHLEEIGFKRDASTAEVLPNHEIYKEEFTNLPRKFTRSGGLSLPFEREFYYYHYRQCTGRNRSCLPRTESSKVDSDGNVITYYKHPSFKVYKSTRVRFAEGQLHIVRFNERSYPITGMLEWVFNLDSHEKSIEWKDCFKKAYFEFPGLHWEEPGWINRCNNIRGGPGVKRMDQKQTILLSIIPEVSCPKNITTQRHKHTFTHTFF